MSHFGERHFQRGSAAWLLIVILLAIGSHAIYRLGYGENLRPNREIKLAKSMQQAKEALIAYAVTDTKQPGRLPCPDIIGNGVSPLLSRDDCDSYNGWLPWKTLDLKEADDDRGTPFHYALSRWFGGDRKSPPLNSDTSGTLSATLADGLETGDIAAIIIASRGALDPANADADLTYRSGNGSGGGDDVLAIITRSELMAAVEKRVAAEARSCLELYARANGYYPWPVPMSATAYQGKPGSYFGQIPETQPQGNPEEIIAIAASEIQSSAQSIASATSNDEQVSALKKASELLAEMAPTRLRPWAHAAQTLADSANLGIVSLGTQSKAINAAVANDRISKTEKTNLRSSALANKESVEKMLRLADDMGVDPFPSFLGQQAQRISLEAGKLKDSTANSATYAPMLDLISSLNELLKISHTNNTEIGGLLDDSYQMGINAFALHTQAAQQIDDQQIRLLAQTSANALIAAVNTLKSGILNQRVAIHPSELTALSEQLGHLSLQFAVPQAQQVQDLLNRLKKVTQTPVFQSAELTNQRNKALSSLTIALEHTRLGDLPASLPKYINPVLEDIGHLAELIGNHGDNVSMTSIRYAMSNYATAERQFATIEPRTQQEMVPYVNALIQPSDDLKTWLSLIHTKAKEIASWDEEASNIVSGINRKGGNLPEGSLSSALSFASRPTEANRLAAQQSKNLTLSALTGLHEKLSSFNASLAPAAPIIWPSANCTMLAADNIDAWWTKNNWKSGIFYQISGRYHDQTGQLSVNNQGKYKLVVISAGQTVWHETSPCLWQQQNSHDRTVIGRKASDFFESDNADQSRNEEAQTPSQSFVSRPIGYLSQQRLTEPSLPTSQCPTTALAPNQSGLPILTFNDQLAY